jgi:hypothetical protein
MLSQREECVSAESSEGETAINSNDELHQHIAVSTPSLESNQSHPQASMIISADDGLYQHPATATLRDAQQHLLQIPQPGLLL